jgi:hypothetical protein
LPDGGGVLEIIAVVWLVRKNSKIAKDKGHSGFLYGLITVGLWVGFELLGIIVGFMVAAGIGVYFLAIIAAVLGGYISNVVAKGLPDNSVGKTGDERAE